MITIFRINKINVRSVVCCHIARHNADTFSGTSPTDAAIIFLPQSVCPVIRNMHCCGTIYHKPYSSMLCVMKQSQTWGTVKVAVVCDVLQLRSYSWTMNCHAHISKPCRYRQRKLKCLFIGFLWTFSMQGKCRTPIRHFSQIAVPRDLNV